MPVKFTFICRTSSGTVSPFSIDRVAEVMCLKKQKILLQFDHNKPLGKSFSLKSEVMRLTVLCCLKLDANSDLESYWNPEE